jgi:hypothetical protein
VSFVVFIDFPDLDAALYNQEVMKQVVHAADRQRLEREAQVRLTFEKAELSSVGQPGAAGPMQPTDSASLPFAQGNFATHLRQCGAVKRISQKARLGSVMPILAESQMAIGCGFSIGRAIYF